MKNTFHTIYIIKSLDRKITKYFHWLIYVHTLFHSILESMNKTHQLISCTLNKVGHMHLKGQMLSFFFTTLGGPATFLTLVCILDLSYFHQILIFFKF